MIQNAPSGGAADFDVLDSNNFDLIGGGAVDYSALSNGGLDFADGGGDVFNIIEQPDSENQFSVRMFFNFNPCQVNASPCSFALPIIHHQPASSNIVSVYTVLIFM